MSEPGGDPAAPVAPGLELIVTDRPFETAGRRLAEWVRELAAARDSVRDSAGGDRRGEPDELREVRVAIPGGSGLAAVVYAAIELGELWQRVALTWVDERCVPVSDPDSNRGEALRTGVLGNPGRAIERGTRPARVVPLFEDGESLEAALARYADRYATELYGGLDFAVLGMGPDGHVASLFPDRPAPISASACVVAFDDAPKPPPRRMSLTRTALATARHTLLVASGSEKRDALARLCAGDPRLPATGLPGLVVVTDQSIDRTAPIDAPIDAPLDAPIDALLAARQAVGTGR